MKIKLNSMRTIRLKLNLETLVCGKRLNKNEIVNQTGQYIYHSSFSLFKILKNLSNLRIKIHRTSFSISIKKFDFQIISIQLFISACLNILSARG